MRFCYALTTTAAILLAYCEVSPAQAQASQKKLMPIDGVEVVTTTITNKRFLRRYSELNDDDNEERIKSGPIILDTPKKIDDFFEMDKLEKMLDPKLADRLLKGKKIWGWLDSKVLDDALHGNFAKKKEVFERLRASIVDSTKLTAFLKLHPSIDHKYRFVYEMYASYLKTSEAKKLSGIKRKRESFR
ncbi:hypothetical protein JG688_00017083 [Phytophthora aleatoria]|uniref:RxLR effector protein n=1 Tax=Phytophthora aleatoria TaxID=2496075 RepID=A0A8J5I3K0_9STRA|nr:hypothetical protein JG688_00017083 [Phytophthora aleatoria]